MSAYFGGTGHNNSFTDGLDNIYINTCRVRNTLETDTINTDTITTDTITTDTITEKTTDNGVNIEKTNIKDGNINIVDIDGGGTTLHYQNLNFGLKTDGVYTPHAQIQSLPLEGSTSGLINFNVGPILDTKLTIHRLPENGIISYSDLHMTGTRRIYFDDKQKFIAFNTASEGLQLGVDSADKISFKTNNIIRMYINANGTFESSFIRNKNIGANYKTLAIDDGNLIGCIGSTKVDKINWSDLDNDSVNYQKAINVFYQLQPQKYQRKDDEGNAIDGIEYGLLAEDIDILTSSDYSQDAFNPFVIYKIDNDGDIVCDGVKYDNIHMLDLQETLRKNSILEYTFGNELKMHNIIDLTNSPEALYVDANGIIGVLPSCKHMKENIKKIDDAKWIYDITPVKYNYKNSNTKEYGFIAEDVEKINKTVCKYRNGKITGIEYRKFIPPLVNNIQTHRNIILDLNDKIEKNTNNINLLTTTQNYDANNNNNNNTQKKCIELEKKIIDLEKKYNELLAFVRMLVDK